MTARRPEGGFLVGRDPSGRRRLWRRPPLRGGAHSDPLRENPKGFTMIEVMVAILLTALTVIGVLGLYKIETRASSYSRRETEAAVLAQDKLESLRTQAAPAGGSTGSENLDDTLTNATAFWQRSWTIAASPSDATVFNITVNVQWNDNGEQRTVTVRGQRGSS